MENYRKIISPKNPNIILRVIPGHFVTRYSHINYYVDMTGMKSRQSEANAVAEEISTYYASSAIVDTIVCLDGCEVIGAYLSEKLTAAGTISMNAHKTIYIMAGPEYSIDGQMIFRENVRSLIKNKHVLVLLASATTGRTLQRVVNTIKYYGGTVTGISAIFSITDEVDGIPVTHIFNQHDLPDYESYSHGECKLCQSGTPVDAMVNSFGYSRVS
ncbi:MAG: phosphoribosyltransferase [Lachnospiraceae bacterium]|nr:phosphoribosyltransferase [Lachnospiraceae bacterium]